LADIWVCYFSLGNNIQVRSNDSTEFYGTDVIELLLLIVVSLVSYSFKAKQDKQSMIKYYGIYLFTLALGSLCIYILRKLLPFKNWVIAFMVVPFTMFMNFILTSLMLKKNRL